MDIYNNVQNTYFSHGLGYIENNPAATNSSGDFYSTGEHLSLINIGSEAEIYKSVDDDNVASLRTIEGLNDIVITQNANTISIDSDLFAENLDPSETADAYIFSSKTDTLNFKSLIGTNAVSITEDTNYITIDVPEGITSIANATSSDGDIYKSNTAGTVLLRSLTEGSNITITQNANDIIISATDTNTTYTASNLGSASDANVFKELSGTDFTFRRLTAGSSISISENSDDIEINCTAGAGDITTGASLGGEAVYASKTGGDTLNFKGLVAGSNCSLGSDGSTITINCALGGGGGGDVYSDISSSTTDELVVFSNSGGKNITKGDTTLIIDTAGLKQTSANKGIYADYFVPYSGDLHLGVYSNPALVIPNSSNYQIGLRPVSTVNHDEQANLVNIYYNSTTSKFNWKYDGTETQFGDIVRSGSFTDNALVRANGTGKSVQESSVIVDDSGNMSGVNILTVNNTVQTDFITEKTAATGVYIESSRIKDDTMYIDKLREYTGSNGIILENNHRFRDGYFYVGDNGIYNYSDPNAGAINLGGYGVAVICSDSLSKLKAQYLIGSLGDPGNINVGLIQFDDNLIRPTSANTLILGTSGYQTQIYVPRLLEVAENNTNQRFLNIDSNGVVGYSTLNEGLHFNVGMDDVLLLRDVVVLADVREYEFECVLYTMNLVYQTVSSSATYSTTQIYESATPGIDGCMDAGYPSSSLIMRSEKVPRKLRYEVSVASLSNTSTLVADFEELANCKNSVLLATLLEDFETNHVVSSQKTIGSTHANLRYGNSNAEWVEIPHVKQVGTQAAIYSLVKNVAVGLVGAIPVVGDTAATAFSTFDLVSSTIADLFPTIPEEYDALYYQSPFGQIPKSITSTDDNWLQWTGITYQDYVDGTTAYSRTKLGDAFVLDTNYVVVGSPSTTQEYEAAITLNATYKIQEHVDQGSYTALYKFSDSYCQSTLPTASGGGDGLYTNIYRKKDEYDDPSDDVRVLDAGDHKYLAYELDFSFNPNQTYISQEDGTDITPGSYNVVYLNDKPVIVIHNGRIYQSANLLGLQ